MKNNRDVKDKQILGKSTSGKDKRNNMQSSLSEQSGKKENELSGEEMETERKLHEAETERD